MAGWNSACASLLCKSSLKWGAENGMLSRTAVLAWILVVTLVGAEASTSETHLSGRSFERRESQLSNSLTRAQEFVDVRHISARQSCEMVNPPEALATPDPLFVPVVHGKRVAISFIIGTDGKVHSPLILESAGLPDDRRVLQTVRTWRYRPATCNGVPTETEGKIEFSIR
jgi:TonB family protein